MSDIVISGISCLFFVIIKNKIKIVYLQQSCYLDIINFFRNWIRKKTSEDQLSFFIYNNIPFNALLIFVNNCASKYPLKKKKENI